MEMLPMQFQLTAETLARTTADGLQNSYSITLDAITAEALARTNGRCYSKHSYC
jgi:hypothetical protein